MTTPQWDPTPEQQPPSPPAPPPGAPMPPGQGMPVSGHVMPGPDSGAQPPVPVSGYVTPGPDSGQQPNLPVPMGGYGQPVPYDDPVIMTIGDISITQRHVIVPTGRFPLRGTTWTVQDSTQMTESIPAYAIVLTLLTIWFLCIFGLLFLLIKQKKVSGFVSITVTGPNLFHSVQLPPGQQNAALAAHQVNQARAMAAVAP
ncbi:MAG: hypothetical protein ACRDTM_10750 [Micromonosporaceae bacterium]